MKNICDLLLAQNLLDNKNYDEALKVYQDLYEDSIETGKESHYLLYYIALCLNNSGKIEEASNYIIRAIQIDPYDLSAEGLANTIFSNIIDDIDREIYNKDAKKKVLELYNFCRNNGRVTSHLQFIMIKHHMYFEEIEQAKYFLDNSLERNPFDKDFLEIRKKIALQENDQTKLTELDRYLLGNMVREVKTSAASQ